MTRPIVKPPAGNSEASRAAQLVQCDLCGAEAGGWCRSSSGKLLYSAHADRRHTYRRLKSWLRTVNAWNPA